MEREALTNGWSESHKASRAGPLSSQLLMSFSFLQSGNMLNLIIKQNLEGKSLQIKSLLRFALSYTET